MELLAYFGAAGIYLLGGAITLVVLKFIDPTMPLDDPSPGAKTVYVLTILIWPAVALWLLIYVPCLWATALANYLTTLFQAKKKEK